MAGFRMHVGTSTVLGCGYAGALNLGYHVPIDSAVVAGAMCGFSGMLPDLDSDYGVPLRETMAFTAALMPMLLVGHFQTLLLTHDQMILAAVGLYLFVRFGITNLIRKYTVHRGMFHSIPACLIFVGLAFLACGTSPIDIRCYKAGGVAAGFMSHLILDEIYAVEWKGGRWRFKKSFGTAIKFWGDDGWSNFTTYAKLAIVAMVILGEPTVIAQIESGHPQFAAQLDQLRGRLPISHVPSAQNMIDAARSATVQFANPNSQSPVVAGPANTFPTNPQPFSPQSPSTGPFQPQPITWPSQRNNVGTAQRPAPVFPQ
jgi:hypothetical protein